MDVTSYLLGKKSSGGGGGGGDDTRWQEIGYEEEPKVIKDGIDYAKEIMQNWDETKLMNNDIKLVFAPLIDTSNITNFGNFFSSDINLISIPLLDTTKAGNMSSMFSGCSSLQSIPLLNTASATYLNQAFGNCKSLQTMPLLNTTNMQNMYNAFIGCPNLTDASLDNILQMCSNTTSSYIGTKTLKSLGLDASNYPASRIQALNHYQDFINAGWGIGY